MMFFNVLGILTEGFYTLTSGIYYFLGSLYTFIVDLATTNFINSSVVADFVRTIYVLAGVFMLFRVAVSFLNSLIDPEKFTDKNEGAGKILKRLIIVVILMIALTPGSFVYNFLDRLQSAVIGKDGLIVNLVGKADLNVGSAVNKYINDINPFGDTYKEVEANDRNNNSSACDFTGNIIEDGNKYYHLNIYYGQGCKDKYTGLKEITGKSYTYYKFVTSTEQVSGSSTKVKCVVPSNVSSVTVGDDYKVYTKKGSKIYINEPQEIKIKDGVMTLYNNVGDCSGNDCIDSAGTLTALEIGKDSGHRDGKKTALDAGGLFAQSVLNTMASCPDVDDQTSEECTDDIKGNILVDSDQVISDIDDEKLSISWLIAIIVGIVVIVYLAVLCIEVVVRSLKLMLLQMVSPIAIISYVSPKDKVLGQWAKMYASTYLDLFIKLFAIKLGAELISAINFSGSVIKDLVLILGCLVFMKVIPTMISKIFGIDIASGTLKDSLGMLKAGVGATAGATVGTLVGASTGKGIGRLTGAVRGFGAGAQSGYKGDIATGAKNVSSKNQRINTAKEQGLNFFDRASATMAARMGMPTRGAAAKDKLAKINDVASANKDLKDWAEGEAVKKNAKATSFTYKDADGNLIDFGDQLTEYNSLMQIDEKHRNLDQKARIKEFQKKGFVNFANGVGVGELQSRLDALESRDTSKMSTKDLAEHTRTLTETKSMLAAAKTAAAANYLRINKDDVEIAARVSKLNDAIAEAKLSGADNISDGNGNKLSFNEIDLNNINEKTIKNIKETAYGMQNVVGKDAEKELAKERYGNTNS